MQAPAANVSVPPRNGIGEVWCSGIITRAMNEGCVYVGVFRYSWEHADGEHVAICVGTAESDNVSSSM